MTGDADPPAAAPAGPGAQGERAAVADVMSTGVAAVAVTAPVTEVAEVLLASRADIIPVVTEDGSVVGVVNEGDLVARLAYGGYHRSVLAMILCELHGEDPRWVRKAEARTAGDVMTAEPATARPDDDLVDIARRLLEGHHATMPVVVGRRLVGTVGRRHLLRALYDPGSPAAPGAASG